jgi:protocatechuate 3,4-dioxygenase alpha subunit
MSDTSPLAIPDLPLRPASGITPSQTVGPYFAYCLTPTAYSFHGVFSNDLVTPDVAGERIRIVGRVFDGNGEPVPDAMIEIWQADGAGRYSTSVRGSASNRAFTGFGRVEATKDGSFELISVKPGPVAGPSPEGRMQAPHISVGVFARGLLKRLHTRIYFADEPANADDPILALVPAEARHTLIATSVTLEGNETGSKVYRFDIHLQGENETVFFAC